jgi:hypothetical protein
MMHLLVGRLDMFDQVLFFIGPRCPPSRLGSLLAYSLFPVQTMLRSSSSWASLSSPAISVFWSSMSLTDPSDVGKARISIITLIAKTVTSNIKQALKREKSLHTTYFTRSAIAKLRRGASSLGGGNTPRPEVATALALR